MPAILTRAGAVRYVGMPAVAVMRPRERYAEPCRAAPDLRGACGHDTVRDNDCKSALVNEDQDR